VTGSDLFENKGGSRGGEKERIRKKAVGSGTKNTQSEESMTRGGSPKTVIADGGRRLLERQRNNDWGLINWEYNIEGLFFCEIQGDLPQRIPQKKTYSPKWKNPTQLFGVVWKELGALVQGNIKKRHIPQIEGIGDTEM